MSFLGGSKTVDLSGKKRKVGAKEEREIRAYERNLLRAATLTQSRLRSARTRREQRSLFRNGWVCTMISDRHVSSLLVSIREFLYFFDASLESDGQLFFQLLKVLTLSMMSPAKSNNFVTLAFDENYHAEWVGLVTRFLSRGHTILRSQQIHENSVFYYLNLLFLLTSAPRLIAFQSPSITSESVCSNLISQLARDDLFVSLQIVASHCASFAALGPKIKGLLIPLSIDAIADVYQLFQFLSDHVIEDTSLRVRIHQKLVSTVMNHLDNTTSLQSSGSMSNSKDISITNSFKKEPVAKGKALHAISLNRQKIVSQFRHLESKTLKQIFSTLLSNLHFAACENRQSVSIFPTNTNSNVMDVVNNDSPIYESYFYCLEVCLQLMDSVSSVVSQKKLEGIEQILPFLPPSLLELSFTEDTDFQTLSSIFAHPKTRAYLERIIGQFSLAVGIGANTLSQSPTLSNLTSLVSSQQLILSREFTSVISVVDSLHSLYRSKSFHSALSTLLAPTFAFLQRLSKSKLLKNLSSEISSPGSSLAFYGCDVLVGSFCAILTDLIASTNDAAFTHAFHFPLTDIIEISSILQTLLGHCWTNMNKTLLSNLIVQKIAGLLAEIHHKDCRLQFMPANHWTIARGQYPRKMTVEEIVQSGFLEFVLDGDEGDPEEGAGRTLSQQLLLNEIALLLKLPFFFTTKEKIDLFSELVKLDQEGQYRIDPADAIPVTIRRDNLVNDAYQKLMPIRNKLRHNIRIVFVNSEGLEEAGFGSGLTKEFLTNVIQQSFTPEYGLFLAQDSNRSLYPNVNATTYQDNCLEKYEFLGMILGKLIYEMIPCDLPLAEFFLKQVIGTSVPTMSDLYSYDNEQYNSFMKLLDLDADQVAALGLEFSTLRKNVITNDVIEENLMPTLFQKSATEEALKVTQSNLHLFFGCYLYYHLSSSIAEYIAAFKRGFEHVIPCAWLSHFNSFELAYLIGGTQGPLDLDDLRKHCRYSNGYYLDHPAIMLFWVVVSEFTVAEQCALLKFVTSCSRPPLLGFSHLDPPFCIHQTDLDRLPSSTTCFNQLKLPPYLEYDQMREKLLFVINSNSGFELS